MNKPTIEALKRKKELEEINTYYNTPEYQTYESPLMDDKLKYYYMCNYSSDVIFVYAKSKHDLLLFIADEIRSIAESDGEEEFSIHPVKYKWRELTEGQMTLGEFLDEYRDDDPWDTPAIFNFDSTELQYPNEETNNE